MKKLKLALVGRPNVGKSALFNRICGKRQSIVDEAEGTTRVVSMGKLTFKENQATDRVHRMGQSRGVQVLKMVTKGTIEEHIHRLIEKKMGLMEEVIGYDDQDQIKSLNRAELLRLLTLMEDEFAGE